MAKIHNFPLGLIPHSPYSLGMAPCDYHLFRNLKKISWWPNFEAIADINSYFDDVNSSTYNETIANLKTCAFHVSPPSYQTIFVYESIGFVLIQELIYFLEILQFRIKLFFG